MRRELCYVPPARRESALGLIAATIAITIFLGVMVLAATI
jgi:hypothetical protein